MTLARLVRCDRGVSIIELTFVLPIFMLVLVGLVDLGMTLRNIEALGDMAKDNARYAAANADDSPCVALRERTMQRTLATLLDDGFDLKRWGPEVCFRYGGDPTNRGHCLIYDSVNNRLEQKRGTEYWDLSSPSNPSGTLPNPNNLTFVKVSITDQRPCTICAERFLKISPLKSQAVFALEPRPTGSTTNPKAACEPGQIEEPLG
mgnify:FL=1